MSCLSRKASLSFYRIYAHGRWGHRGKSPIGYLNKSCIEDGNNRVEPVIGLKKKAAVTAFNQDRGCLVIFVVWTMFLLLSSNMRKWFVSALLHHSPRMALSAVGVLWYYLWPTEFQYPAESACPSGLFFSCSKITSSCISGTAFQGLLKGHPGFQFHLNFLKKPHQVIL